MLAKKISIDIWTAFERPISSTSEALVWIHLLYKLINVYKSWSDFKAKWSLKTKQCDWWFTDKYIWDLILRQTDIWIPKSDWLKAAS